jgi:predicted nuclease of predicted toxin-antitoxin system
MPIIRLLADMNISPKSVFALENQGWDIVRVSQLLPAAALDEEILEFARKENRTVITQDLDFSALLALGGHDRPSLLTLRLSDTDPEFVTARLLEVLPLVEEKLNEGCVVVIQNVTVRLRMLPIQ